MNNAVNNYRHEVEKKLCCLNSTKKQLLLRFDKVLSAYLEDDPSPTYERLAGAFGTPEAMAKTLMSEVSEEERTRYGRSRRYSLGAAITLAVALIVFLSVWIFTSLHAEEVYSTGIVYISEPVYSEENMYDTQEDSEPQGEAGKESYREESLP